MVFSVWLREGQTCSEGCMAQQVSRMAPQRSASAGDKFMREASGGRGQERAPQQQQQRPGLSGPHQSGPARAPLSPYSSGGRGQQSHRVSRCLCRQSVHAMTTRLCFAPQSAAAAHLPVVWQRCRLGEANSIEAVPTPCVSLQQRQRI